MSNVPHEWVEACKRLHQQKVFFRSNKNGKMLQRGWWRRRASCAAEALGIDQELLVIYSGESNLVFIQWCKEKQMLHRTKDSHLEFNGTKKGDAEKFHLEFRGDEVFLTPRQSPHRVYVRDDCIVGAYGCNGKTWGQHESFTILDKNGQPALSLEDQQPAPVDTSRNLNVEACKRLHQQKVFFRSNKNGKMLQRGWWKRRASCAAEALGIDQELLVIYSGESNLVFIQWCKEKQMLHRTKDSHLEFNGTKKGDAEKFHLEFRGDEVFLTPRQSPHRVYVRDDCIVGAYDCNGKTWGQHESFTILDKNGQPALSLEDQQPAPVDTSVRNLDGKRVWLVSEHTGNVLQNSSGGMLRAVNKNMLGWEQLTIEYSGEGNIVFLVSGKDGKVLQCNQRGDLQFANENRQAWERFGLEFKGDRVFLESKHLNKTIQVRPDGKCHCSNHNRLEWEAFTLVKEDKVSEFNAKHKAQSVESWGVIARAVNGKVGFVKSNYNGMLWENRHGEAAAIGTEMRLEGEITVEYSGEANIVYLVSRKDGNALQCDQKGKLRFANKDRGLDQRFRLEIHGTMTYFESCRLEKTIQVAHDDTLRCSYEYREGRESFIVIPKEGGASAPPASPPPASSIERQSQRCRSCKKENDPDANFCSECGDGLTEGSICPKCHEVNPEDSNFCTKCGHNMAEPVDTQSGAPTVNVNVTTNPPVAMPVGHPLLPASAPPFPAFPVSGPYFTQNMGISPFPVGQGPDGQPQMIYEPSNPTPAKPIKKGGISRFFKKLGL